MAGGADRAEADRARGHSAHAWRLEQRATTTILGGGRARVNGAQPALTPTNVMMPDGSTQSIMWPTPDLPPVGCTIRAIDDGPGRYRFVVEGKVLH
jgi:hypothetical protein